MVRRYYIELYSNGPQEMLTDVRLDFPPLDHCSRRVLNQAVSPQEIETAVFQIGPFKAPGPDGLPPVFFQRNWDLVKTTIIKFIQQSFRQQKFASEDSALVVLIPKMPHPETIAQFRPIALTNVLTKIISKVIANRLKKVISKLVSATQCAFTLGRQASDNIIVAQELLHTIRNKTGKKGFMVVKVDLEKAYDQVSWPFMRRLLEEIGFSHELISLIMFTITSATMTIIWNGQRMPSFQPT